jgi:hypothetical protein
VTSSGFKPSESYVNPIHIAFAICDIGLKESVSLQTLFMLLDKLDSFERDRLLGLVSYAIGVETRNFQTEEECVDDRYRQFKQKCDALGAMDHFIVHGVVLQVLNQFRYWADEAHSVQATGWIQGFIEFSRARGATEQELDNLKIFVESRTVTKKSDAMNARLLYDSFCEKVARPLLEMT